MARHSFIQMSKLPNVKGRISYITSHARQENLYATYRTADNEFWSNLARESQQEFKRSGTEGKCIEARELIIALPEVYTRYEPQEVLEDFTEEFHRRYGVECVSALHHNKRKTNYHIHLIFSERKLLPELFFVKYFSLKKASKFPVFVKGFSLLLAGIDYASRRMRACSIR